MRKKPYVQGRQFYLGGRRRQKGGFLLGPGVGLGFKLVKKLLGGRRRNRRRRW